MTKNYGWNKVDSTFYLIGPHYIQMLQRNTCKSKRLWAIIKKGKGKRWCAITLFPFSFYNFLCWNYFMFHSLKGQIYFKKNC